MTDSDSGGAKAYPLPFLAKHILVPMDMRHADASEPAIETAVQFARTTDARVSILTVMNPLSKQLNDMPQAREPEFHAYVARQSERLGYPIAAIFESHEAVNEIIRKTVKKHGIDFVVMASHHPRLTDHLFGSHASQTALHADCSVLLVRG